MRRREVGDAFSSLDAKTGTAPNYPYPIGLDSLLAGCMGCLMIV